MINLKMTQPAEYSITLSVERSDETRRRSVLIYVPKKRSIIAQYSYYDIGDEKHDKFKKKKREKTSII